MAIARAKEVLERERNDIRLKIYHNKRAMAGLVRDNTTYKRELVVITDLLRSVEGKPRKGTKP